jgi:hypothetical protein
LQAIRLLAHIRRNFAGPESLARRLRWAGHSTCQTVPPWSCQAGRFSSKPQRWNELGKETPFKKIGEPLVAVGFGLQPLNHGRAVKQMLQIGGGGGNLRFNPKFARMAVQLCLLMSSPECCLIAAPGGCNNDEGEQHSFRDSSISCPLDAAIFCAR